MHTLHCTQYTVLIHIFNSYISSTLSLSTDKSGLYCAVVHDCFHVIHHGTYPSYFGSYLFIRLIYICSIEFILTYVYVYFIITFINIQRTVTTTFKQKSLN